MAELSDVELELRPFVEDDAPLLEAIFAEGEVKRWWPAPDYVRESGWTVLREGVVGGWLEYHDETYEWYPSVAFDIALATPLHGHGYGRRVLELGVAHFMARGHHRFTVDPNAENERAIRCYEAVGFQRVGVMRAYERSREGGWNDGLLMELIRFPEET
ncbi:MAG TPA: GNAT family protein [Solirubrobacteraceae bacterium]|jgi:aminoglycoside 6'-N-acetyltransferase